MNKKSTCPIEAVTFNAEYADIQAGAKLIAEELKKNVTFIEKLGKRAAKLYKYGNKKCYTDTNKGFKPIDGIKNIRDKMDNLEWLQDVKFELKELMAYFNI